MERGSTIPKRDSEQSFLDYSSDSQEIEMERTPLVRRDVGVGLGGVFVPTRVIGRQARSETALQRKRRKVEKRGLILFPPTLIVYFTLYAWACVVLMLPRQFLLEFVVVGFMTGVVASIYFSTGTLFRVIFPMFIFTGMLLASGWSHYAERWTLRPGESRVVRAPAGYFLTESVRIDLVNAFDGLDVYGSSQVCPPLSGPRKLLRNEYSMNVSFGDYEFDYYFLNQGSTIEVTLSAQSGEARLLVFSGFSSFKCWADQKCQLHDESRILHTSYVFAPRCYNLTSSPGGEINGTSVWCDNTPSWRNSIANITHFNATVSEAHTVILVYEGVTGNALKGVWGKTFEGNAVVRVNLASYNLSQLNPIPWNWCSADGKGCLIHITPWAWAECIVLQAAPSKHIDTNSYVRLTDVESNDGMLVTVDISMRQQWVFIFGVSAVPVILSVLFDLTKKLKTFKMGGNNEFRSDGPNEVFIYGNAVDLWLQ